MNDPIPTVDRPYVEDLVRLSISGLERMYDSTREALYSFDYSNGRAVRVEHLGLRYTVMSALGIHEARDAGFETTLDPATLLRSGVEQFTADDIDHLAMAIWADCTVDAGVTHGTLPRLLKALEAPQERTIGRPLAWALTALSLHGERDDDPQVRRAAKTLRDLAVNGAWREEGGLFCHTVGRGKFTRRLSLFSTQIYWVYALAVYGRVFADEESLRIAERCADTLITLRDPFFGWPWRYDAARGRITERYPVYAVHQDAMAPMALHVLGDAVDRSFAAVNRESMSWLRRNDLGLDMVDPEHQAIYRAVRRRFPFNRIAMNVGKGAALMGKASPTGEKPWFLRLNATCRPYHLGWLLHAWAKRLDQVEA